MAKGGKRPAKASDTSKSKSGPLRGMLSTAYNVVSGLGKVIVETFGEPTRPVYKKPRRNQANLSFASATHSLPSAPSQRGSRSSQSGTVPRSKTQIFKRSRRPQRPTAPAYEYKRLIESQHNAELLAQYRHQYHPRSLRHQAEVTPNPRADRLPTGPPHRPQCNPKDNTASPCLEQIHHARWSRFTDAANNRPLPELKFRSSTPNWRTRGSGSKADPFVIEDKGDDENDKTNPAIGDRAQAAQLQSSSRSIINGSYLSRDSATLSSTADTAARHFATLHRTPQTTHQGFVFGSQSSEQPSGHTATRPPPRAGSDAELFASPPKFDIDTPSREGHRTLRNGGQSPASLSSRRKGGGDEDGQAAASKTSLACNFGGTTSEEKDWQREEEQNADSGPEVLTIPSSDDEDEVGDDGNIDDDDEILIIDDEDEQPVTARSKAASNNSGQKQDSKPSSTSTAAVEDWEAKLQACKQSLYDAGYTELDRFEPTHRLYTTWIDLQRLQDLAKVQLREASLTSTALNHMEDALERDLARFNQIAIQPTAVFAPGAPLDGMEAAVDDALRPSQSKELLGSVMGVSAYEFTRYDAQFLQPSTWLNDTCVNGIFTLVYWRSQRVKTLPNIWMFTSFFWVKLAKGYDNVRRWTRRARLTPDAKPDVFAFDMILFPINVNASHWVCACIDFRKKTIAYYDSYHSSLPGFFKKTRQWLNDEHQNKKNKPFDFTGWTNVPKPDCPTQYNSVDCGVFTGRCAEYLSRDAPFDYDEDDMEYFRRRTVAELIKGKLMNE